MRLGVFSDVHGNLVAFDAFLADAAGRGIDGLVCLGDALQGGPEPRACLDRLLELGCPVVLGNADAFLVELDPALEDATEEQLDVARWTRDQLGRDGIDAIRAFRPTVTVELGGGRTLLAMHAAPSSIDLILLPSTPEAELRAALANVAADVVAGGHVHMQWTRPIAHRVFLNPGSVGLPYDHEQEDELDPRLSEFAEYAVVDSDEQRISIELHRVRFDARNVVRATEASSRPHAESYVRAWR